MDTATISSKGQIVIPKHIRKLLKLSAGDKLSIMLDQGGVALKPVAKKEPEAWVRLKGCWRAPMPLRIVSPNMLL